MIVIIIIKARSCQLSVLRMNQTDELATKRVFGGITFLITDYSLSLATSLVQS